MVVNRRLVSPLSLGLSFCLYRPRQEAFMLLLQPGHAGGRFLNLLLFGQAVLLPKRLLYPGPFL